jgi:hypothetical protein
MAFPPRGFLIGAQKSGTTTLAELLDQHPNVVLAKPKEPNFFNLNWDQGFDWYRRCFATDEGVLIDASVSYSMADQSDWDLQREQEVPRRIHAASPDAKFIYVVRDPAERCHSAYWHEVRARGEKRTLREVVTQRAYYTMAGYYFRQIGRYLPYFPLDRFLIVRFEDLVAAPAEVAQRCIKFLEAGRDDYSFVYERPKNRGFRYNHLGYSLRNMIGSRAMDRLTQTGSQLLPAGLQSIARKMIVADLPALNGNDRDWLNLKYAEDMAAFERLTGVRVGSAGGAQEMALDQRGPLTRTQARSHNR